MLLFFFILPFDASGFSKFCWNFGCVGAGRLTYALGKPFRPAERVRRDASPTPRQAGSLSYIGSGISNA